MQIKFLCISNGKTFEVESILSESKLEQRVMVEGNGNSTDVCKRKDDRPIFAHIAPSKKITDNQKFRKRRSETYAEAFKMLGHQTLVGKSLNH